MYLNIKARFLFIKKIGISKWVHAQTTSKTRGELWCSGRVGSSCSTSGTRRMFVGNKKTGRQTTSSKEQKKTPFRLNRRPWYEVNSWRIEFKKKLNFTSGAGTSYPSGAPEFTPGFWCGLCYSIFSFICMFCRSLLVLLYFFF
jgi:hypothetical protein